jgi:hypothetical protein
MLKNAPQRNRQRHQHEQATNKPQLNSCTGMMPFELHNHQRQSHERYQYAKRNTQRTNPLPPAPEQIYHREGMKIVETNKLKDDLI